MFHLNVHPEARAWVPSEAQLTKLRTFFQDPAMVVNLWPRRMVSNILGRPSEPYAFRAFTRDGISHIFVDPTETRESVAWLMGHELTHKMIDSSPTLSIAFADAKPIDLDVAGDRFHEIDAEERFCDGIATRLLGYRQDREWWRKRVPQR